MTKGNKSRDIPKDESRFIKFIQSTIDEYKDLLGLSLHELGIENSNKVSYLGYEYRHPYIDSNILYTQEAVDDFTKGKLDKYRIVHELFHGVTDRFYAVATDRYIGKNELEDERENLVERLTAIVKKLES